MRKQHFIIRYKLKIKKVNERTSGGGNPGHTNKNDFFYIFLSRTNFTEGSNFKGNYTFQSSRGVGGGRRGVQHFHDRSNFFPGGGRVHLLIPMETCRTRVIANVHDVFVYALKNCVSIYVLCVRGFGETAVIRRLGAFVARTCNKNNHRLCVFVF